MDGQKTRTTIFFGSGIGILLLIPLSSPSSAAAATGITSTGGFAGGSMAVTIPVVLSIRIGEAVVVACSDCSVVTRGVVDSERVAFGVGVL